MALPSFQDEVAKAARVAMSLNPAMGNERYDDDWLRQAVRGFVQLASEAAAGTGRGTRELFFGTVVPGLLADGQTPTSLLRASATFLALLGSQLILTLPQEEQAEAAVWFANFAGSYIEDLHRASQEGTGP